MSTIQKAVGKLDNRFGSVSTSSEVDKSSSDAADDENGMVRIGRQAVDNGVENTSSESDDRIPDTNVNDKQQAPVDEPAAATARRVLALPIKRFKNASMITPDEPISQVAEEFRSIKLTLLSNMDEQNAECHGMANVMMVTSCVEGEGKTFSAVNLAISLAMERDKKVLLIDADVMKSAASALLGTTQDQPGLSDLLKDEKVNVGDVICDTDMPNLRFMAAGTRSDHATELLSSDGMKRLIQQVAARYPDRIIVFDAPPVLATSEAIVLATLVGQIVFVVEAESTSHSMVSDALSRIRGKAWTGLILNKTRKRLGTGYGYGYGYGQGISSGTGNGGPGAT